MYGYNSTQYDIAIIYRFLPRQDVFIYQVTIALTMDMLISDETMEMLIHNTIPQGQCSLIHPGYSCNQKAFAQAAAGIRAVTKMYLIVHLVPFLIFKRKKVRQQPYHEIRKLLTGFLKSIMFAGAFCWLCRRSVCPIWKLESKFLPAQDLNMMSAPIGGISVLLEARGRRAEIALFTMSRCFQIVYLFLKRRGLAGPIPGGQGLLLASAMAIIAFHYFDCPAAIRDSYLKLLHNLLQNC